MATLEQVYAKFGEVAEAAQLLETELGTTVLMIEAAYSGLLAKKDRVRAADLMEKVSKKTMGGLIAALSKLVKVSPTLETLLSVALDERNRLNHHFYREHNFRRNTSAGCALMLTDLDGMHAKILDAYVELVKTTSGVDMRNTSMPLPTKHLPI